MKFILEFVAVMTVGVLPNLLAAFLHLRNADYLRKFEQLSVSEKLPNIWLGAVGSISVVLLVAYQQPTGFASVGIRSGQWGSNILAVLIGFFGINIFLILFALGQKIILSIFRHPSPPALDKSSPSVTDNLSYEDNWERIANLTVLPFSTIAEDLIYRGYLILLLGKLTNTFLPWALISIFIMVLLHIYQGRTTRRIIYHILLAGFFAVLTITTQNILAPITAHVYHNFIHRVKLWSLMTKQDQPMPTSANSTKRKLAYALFSVANIIILILATIMALA